jgi:hypothetical protein
MDDRSNAGRLTCLARGYRRKSLAAGNGRLTPLFRHVRLRATAMVQHYPRCALPILAGYIALKHLILFDTKE